MPIPVISTAQMREWEESTWALGRTEAEVIGRVGEAVGRLALRLTGPGDTVCVLAGKGHNGADALGACNILAERHVEILNIADPGGDLKKLEAQLALRPALVIDGLFGIGLNRPLSGEWVQFITALNAAQLRVLAVDVPSGLNADSGETYGAAVEATVTVSVGAPKQGLLDQRAWPFVGRLEVADDVGLAPCPVGSELNWSTAKDFAGYPPPRAAATHKGSYGHLAIVAGSVGYHGAAVLAARAAQRARPGLISLYTADAVYPMVAAQLQAVMVAPWRPELKLPGACSAVLIGPGLAASDVPDGLKTVARHLWRDATVPVIVDASALDWLVLEGFPRNAVRVITPHPGEAARLLRCPIPQVQANRVNALREVSRRLGQTWVVLKGHQTLIGRASGPVWFNSSGNPFLAQGGSGDVLAGFLAGLLAQPALQTDLLRAVRYAVWQHGAAADSLQATQLNWIVEDLLPILGSVTAVR